MGLSKKKLLGLFLLTFPFLPALALILALLSLGCGPADTGSRHQPPGVGHYGIIYPQNYTPKDVVELNELVQQAMDLVEKFLGHPASRPATIVFYKGRLGLKRLWTWNTYLSNQGHQIETHPSHILGPFFDHTTGTLHVAVHGSNVGNLEGLMTDMLLHWHMGDPKHTDPRWNAWLTEARDADYTLAANR